MRASRLLSLLLLLQTRGRMTAGEIARELGVSVRTVYRDVESLSSAGVPVYAERGSAGGYQLLEGYRTRLTGLTEDEARSLLFAGMPAAATELGLGEVLAAAQLKLSAALPAVLRIRAGRVRERFLLDPLAWFREADSVPWLAAVARAVWDEHRIEVRYQRWDRSVVDRTLEPLGLVLKSGVWYLIAGAANPRMYRVSRIHACRPLDETFRRPEGFVLAEFWARREEALQARLFRGEAEVRLSPRARRLLFLLGPVVAEAGARRASTPDRDGWVRTTLPIESLEHATGELLRFGPDVEVLRPPQLRDRVRRAAEELLRRYHG
ncbi:helix-turn-helix transcriptional regulator [Gandjariella thermophila]|uniref:Transcriptional regulator n=1 Tax=Gandjariella thermophila TaxID=1931992 RepID=A0A4D4J6N4_9PSEU|nr:YafY family protein [Gandjariella thermophila]GDY32261.1 transcriptional regulator [Gandjariella thermophila]